MPRDPMISGELMLRLPKVRMKFREEGLKYPKRMLATERETGCANPATAQ